MDSEIQRQFRGETNPLNTAFSPPSRSDVPLTSEAKRKIKDLVKQKFQKKEDTVRRTE